MIESWLQGIRDHPKRPPGHQVHSLVMLALRLDWKTGEGFAAIAQVAADADASRSTVQRATRWGRDNSFLVQTKRGHRISADRVTASEWKILLPTQCVTGDTLTSDPTSQERHVGPTQCVNDPRPNVSVESFHQESSTSRARARAAEGGAHTLNGHNPAQAERDAIRDLFLAGNIGIEEKTRRIKAINATEKSAARKAKQ